MTTDWCYNNRSEQDTVQPPHQDEVTEGAVKNDDGADHQIIVLCLFLPLCGNIMLKHAKVFHVY